MVWRAELGSIRERDLIWLLTGTNACAMRPGCARLHRLTIGAQDTILSHVRLAAYFARCAACSTRAHNTEGCCRPQRPEHPSSSTPFTTIFNFLALIPNHFPFPTRNLPESPCYP